MVTVPKVYFVRFSDSATSFTPSTGYIDQTFANTEPNGPGVVADIIDSAHAAWRSEYSRPDTGQLLTAGTYAGLINLNYTIPDQTSVDNSDISQALADAQASGSLPPLNSNNIFVLFFRAGQTITVNSVGWNSISNFCAYHTSLTDGTTSLNYVVMPNESANSGCLFTGPSSSAFDNMTPVLSHELVETITDPTSPAGWYDDQTGNEIGDICEASWPLAGIVTSLSSVNYSLQKEFSNQAGSCILTKPTAATLRAAATPGSTTSVAASLTTPTGPLSGAALTLSLGPVWRQAGDGTIATATTDAQGKATFSISPTSTSNLTVTYAGNGSTSGGSVAPGWAQSAPTITSAIPGSASATVYWTPGADTGGGAISGYTATASPGGSSCSTTATPQVPVAPTSCTITGLSNGQTYSVSVVTLNSATSSAPSAAASVTPQASPLSPQSVTAVGGVASVRVSWAAPTPLPSSPITSYTATVSPSNASCSTSIVAPATSPALTCDITGLAAGTSYTATVTATNAFGTSPPSPGVVATTDSPPSPPQSPSAIPGDRQITASWSPASSNGSAITSYDVTVYDQASIVGNCSARAGQIDSGTCTITGLANQKTYKVVLTATNAIGTSPEVDLSVQMPTPPTAPARVVATPQAAGASVSWFPSQDGGLPISTYTATATTFSSSSTGQCRSTSTTCVITGLTPGVDYNIRVTATNPVGTSPDSDPALATTLNVPTTPAVTVVSPTSTAITFAWFDATSGGTPVTSYTLTVSPGSHSCQVQASSQLQCTVSGLTSSTSYSYSLVATNALGNSMPASGSTATSATGLVVGKSIGLGKSCWSSDSQWQLLLQSSGNLVVSGKQGITWSTKTAGLGVTAASLASNGALILTDRTGAVLWSNKRTVATASSISFDNTGNLVAVTSSGDPYWSSQSGPIRLPAPPSSASTLTTSAKLTVGKSLVSANGAYHAKLRATGSFVITNNAGSVLWNNKVTDRRAGDSITVTSTGDLREITSSGSVLFSTGSSAFDAAYLVMGNDGHLSLLSAAGKKLWHS